MATLKNTTISNTDALTIASGTQVQRPSIVSKVQSFSSPGSWTAPTGVTNVEVLVVAGGGGTGWDVGGGGGGGGVLYAQSFPVTPGTPYPVSVGSGGASAGSSAVKGSNGGNSTFGGLTAVGGGGGGAYPGNGVGNPGGSGGGGGDQFAAGGSGTQGPGPGGATGYGFPGGISGQAWTGGGGGGAGGAGQGAGGIYYFQDTRTGNLSGGDGSIALPGGWQNYPGSGGYYEGTAALGGPGLTFTITGTAITYSGGGHGMSDGGFIQPTNPNPGWGANGSGEGGTYFPGTPGVVVLRWRTPSDAETSGYTRFNTDTRVIESNEGSGFSSLQDLTGQRIIKFTEVGSWTWTVPAGVTSVRVLVVAGGGGGCERHGGGGGGGGMLEHFGYPVTPGGSIPVVVGAGGKGLAKPAGNPFGNPGYQGFPSRFGDIITYGGGGGFSDGSNQGDPRATGGGVQLAGGSGGGGSHNPGNQSGLGIIGQGFPGGGASSSTTSRGGTGPYPGTTPPHAGGGGGGAGGAGEPSRSPSESGNGGPGRASDITGSVVFYAGGGGGSSHAPQPQAGTGGVGGGGQGGNPGFFQPGVNGTGGGGGAAGNDPAPVGGYGGSGIVIIRY